MRKSFAFGLLLLLTSATVPAAAQQGEEPAPVRSYDLEVGYRTLNVIGSEDLYRTQINERSGLVLRTFTLLTSGPAEGVYDSLRIDASDLGVAPGGSLRVEANKRGRYRLTLNYRRTYAFSALPAFANPLLGLGILPGQHTYDRRRDVFDTNIEMLPNSIVSPFVGFSYRRLNGPGTTTTFFSQNDEFRLAEDLREHEQEVRAGTAFNFGRFHGSVSHGWRRLSSVDAFSLIAPQGNNGTPILGRTPTGSAIDRNDRIKVTTPFTNVFANGQVTQRLRLRGTYVHYAADSTKDQIEDASGSFLAFDIGRFFSGVTQHISSSAKNTTSRGGAQAELNLIRGVDLFAGYQSEHRDLGGDALLETLYLQTLTFAGLDPRDVGTVLQTTSTLRRNEEIANGGISARGLGGLALRVEVRDDRQHVDVAPDLLEIVLPGNQRGTFERRDKSIEANASFMKHGLYLGAGFRHDSADEPIFRTDFIDRDRARFRAAWRGTPWLHVSVTAEQTRETNPRTGFELSGKAHQYAGDLEVIPHSAVRLHGSLSAFTTDNSIVYRRPDSAAPVPSLYMQRGTVREGGITLTHNAFSFDADATQFTNRGDNPFAIRRVTAALGFDFPGLSKTGMLVEASQDHYDEPSVSYARFHARRIGLFFRQHR